MTKLTTENAKYVTLVRSISHPEWGNMQFIYNDVALNNGEFVSTVNIQRCLFEHEYFDFEIIATAELESYFVKDLENNSSYAISAYSFKEAKDMIHSTDAELYMDINSKYMMIKKVNNKWIQL